MKFLIITCILGFLTALSAKSQDSLQSQTSPVSQKYYKAYIFKSERHPAKGYLVTIQDSAVFMSTYENKSPLNFANAKLPSLQRFDYRDIQKMKVFNPKTVGRCILIGAISGIVAGAIIGYASGDDHGWFALTAGGKAVVGAVLGGCVGTAVGAIVGQGYTKEYFIDGEWKSLQEVKDYLQKVK